MSRVRWGVLGAAKIATEKVIPAMMQGQFSAVTAIASRDRARAEAAARRLGIPQAHGSYEALLDDPEIDAVYIPLPNHLHVPWSTRAAERGKHVLCEKPIALTAADARQLVTVRDRTGVKIQEAFMVRTHPQWLKTRELIREGRIGSLRSMLGHFSYFNEDASNIRNIAAFGGGGLMDIGCYLINTARFVFERPPERVVGLIDNDPRFNVDRTVTLMLDFGDGHAAGTCSTQMAFYQRIHLFGTRGRIEIEIPFNAPPDHPCRVFLDQRGDISGKGIEEIRLDPCNQYTIQGDLFSRAVLEGTDVPVPLEDAVVNMECIEAVFRSGESGHWERPGAIRV
jgi:predicted dehydrogenase